MATTTIFKIFLIILILVLPTHLRLSYRPDNHCNNEEGQKAPLWRTQDGNMVQEGWCLRQESGPTTNDVRVNGVELPLIEKCDENREYLRPGNSYNFNYVVTTVGTAVGSTNHLAGINIKCTVQLHAKDNHLYILQVDACTLSEISTPGNDEIVEQHLKSDQFSSEMKTYPVQFTMCNGTIHGLLAHDKEALHILNIKRGIITALMTKKVSSQHGTEMRTDVQGTCPVSYDYSQDEAKLIKDMNNCHFPSKFDWPYSPLSMFWNMSFIQMFWIKSTAHCNHHFRDDGLLKDVLCRERHAILLESTANADISVQTNIKQQLTLNHISPLMKSLQGRPNTEYFRLTNIQYEYESIVIPQENPINLQHRVMTLLKSLVTDVNEPIDPEKTTLFGQLIDVLRESADLTAVTSMVIELSNSPYKLQSDRIWRDALIQCNRLPCIKAFRFFLTRMPDPHVVSDTYLDFIFFAWTNAQINDLNIIQEIMEITKTKPKSNRILALSSIANSYWQRHKKVIKDQIPKVLHDVVDLVAKPFKDVCIQHENGTHSDVTTSLMAMANLAEVIEILQPNLLDHLHACITRSSIDSLIPILVVQVAKQLHPTDNLREKAMDILQNSKLNHDVRILAYHLLFEKFNDSKLASDIVTILKENRTPSNLRSFIVTHIKSSAKDRSPTKSNIPRLVLELLPWQYKSQLPLFDKSLLAKYNEWSFYHFAPFLRDSINEFGYRLSNIDLYENHARLPWHGSKALKVTLFGKSMDLVEALFTLKEHKAAHEQRNEGDIAFSFKFLGDALLTAAFKDFSDFKNQLVAFWRHLYAQDSTETSSYWKVVEAFNQVPTLSGMPLNWTTNAYVIYNSKRDVQLTEESGSFSNRRIYDWTLSAAATLRNGMEVDLPGYTNCGVRSFSTAATALKATVELGDGNDDAVVVFGFRVPQRPMQLLSLTRRNFIVRRYQTESIPDWDVERVTNSWCSNALVPFVGTKLCHYKSYPSVTHRADKPWTLMAGDSDWNYTTEYVAKNSYAYKFALHTPNPVKDVDLVYEAVVSTLDQKDNKKYKDILNYYHKLDRSTGEYQTSLNIPDIPTFKAKVSRKKQDGGYLIQADLTVTPRLSYKFNYETKVGNQHISQELFKKRPSKLPKEKMARAVIAEKTINFTTPCTQYTFMFKQHRFTQATVINFFTKYESLSVSPTSSQKPNVTPCYGGNTFWLELHHERQESIPDTVSAVTPRQSYSYLKSPSVNFQLETLISSTPTEDVILRINLTQHVLNNLVPQQFSKAFINTTYTLRRFQLDETTKKAVHAMVVHSLYNTYEVQFNQTKSSNADEIALVVQLRKYGFQLPRKPVITTRFAFDGKSVKATQEHSRPSYFGIQLENPKDYFANYTYRNSIEDREGKNYVGKFKSILHQDKKSSGVEAMRVTSLELNGLQYGWDVQLYQGLNQGSSYYVSRLNRFPDFQIASHEINSTFVRNFTKINENWTTPYYKRLSNLLISHLVEDASLNLTLDIKAFSKENDLLNMNLIQKVANHAETMQMTHNLVDIDVAAQWISEYKKSFKFTSKDTDIIPNMQWNIHFVNKHNGTFHFRFPDEGVDLYVNFQMSSGGTEMTLSACLQSQCSDLLRDPDSFVGQVTLTLDHGQYLTRTITFNPKVLPFIQRRLSGKTVQLAQFISITSRYLNDYESAIWDISSPITGIFTIGSGLIRESFTILFSTTTLVSNDIATFGTNVVPASYILQSLHYSKLGWFINYFNIQYEVYRWLDSARAIISAQYMYGYHPAKSKNTYVQTFEWPVIMQNFTDYSKGSGPAFFRDFAGVYLGRSTTNEMFFNKNFDKVALLYKTGTVYTFDSRLLTLPAMTTRDDHTPESTKTQAKGRAENVPPAYDTCTYLLGRNDQNRLKIHYRPFSNNFLNINFKGVSLTLSNNGQIKVNESARDLPLKELDGSIEATRWQTFIRFKVGAPLQIICHLSEDLFCLFYTSSLHFEEWDGVLGNNNGDPFDDTSDTIKYELSPKNLCIQSPSGCKTNDMSQMALSYLRWHPNSPTLPCHDVVNNSLLFGHPLCGDFSCGSLNAYLAICAAYGVPVGKTLDTCVSCGDRKVETPWIEKVEDKLEVIFLVDQLERSSSPSLVKGIETLMNSIKKEFAEEGYQTISFGLTGFRGSGFRNRPLLHSINGKLLASSNEFATYGLRTLDFKGESTGTTNEAVDDDVAAKALLYAAEQYSLNPKAAHIFILLTPYDISGSELSLFTTHKVLKKLEKQGVALYVISNYDDISKSKGDVIYGVRGDGYVFPQPKSGNEVYVDFPTGHLARLSSATRGTVWQTAFLEDKYIPPKRYLQEVAKEMLARAKQDSRKGVCKRCSCVKPIYYQPQVLCDFTSCT